MQQKRNYYTKPGREKDLFILIICVANESCYTYEINTNVMTVCLSIFAQFDKLYKYLSEATLTI